MSKAAGLVAAAALCLAACAPRQSDLGRVTDASSPDGAPDGAPDAAPDAAFDEALDAAADGVEDGRLDAAADLGPACQIGGTRGDLPVTLGCTEAPLGRIVIGGDHLYWTVQGPGAIVMRAPLTGGGGEALAFDDAGAFGLAVDATFVYYAQPARGRIMRLPLAGKGVPEALATQLDQPLWLASDGKSLFWTGGQAGGAGTVMKLALTPGAEPVTLVDGQSQPRALALRDGFVYWTDIVDGTILRTPDHLLGPADAGVRTASRLASGLKVPTDLLLIGAYAYAPDRAGHVQRVPLEGGALEAVADVDGQPYSIASDGVALYWSVLGAGGGIFTGPLAPGAGKGTLVVGDQPDPHFVVLTAQHVYWSTWGAYPAVHRLAR